jgi:hypothetical protein
VFRKKKRMLPQHVKSDDSLEEEEEECGNLIRQLDKKKTLRDREEYKKKSLLRRR